MIGLISGVTADGLKREISPKTDETVKAIEGTKFFFSLPVVSAAAAGSGNAAGVPMSIITTTPTSMKNDQLISQSFMIQQLSCHRSSTSDKRSQKLLSSAKKTISTKSGTTVGPASVNRLSTKSSTVIIASKSVDKSGHGPISGDAQQQRRSPKSHCEWTELRPNYSGSNRNGCNSESRFVDT